MLASFQIRRTFNKLRATIYVDCEAKDASLMVTYDRRILHCGYGTGLAVFFQDVSTPEKAESWLGAEVADCREKGAVISRLEAMELDARRQPLGLHGRIVGDNEVPQPMPADSADTRY